MGIKKISTKERRRKKIKEIKRGVRKESNSILLLFSFSFYSFFCLYFFFRSMWWWTLFSFFFFLNISFSPYFFALLFVFLIYLFLKVCLPKKWDRGVPLTALPFLVFFFLSGWERPKKKGLSKCHTLIFSPTACILHFLFLYPFLPFFELFFLFVRRVKLARPSIPHRLSWAICQLFCFFFSWSVALSLRPKPKWETISHWKKKKREQKKKENSKKKNKGLFSGWSVCGQAVKVRKEGSPHNNHAHHTHARTEAAIRYFFSPFFFFFSFERTRGVDSEFFFFLPRKR